MVAERFSRCVVCTATIAPGDEVERVPENKVGENRWCHADCNGEIAEVPKVERPTPPRRAWPRRQEDGR